MDLIWLLIIWAIVGLLGVLRKPPRGTVHPQSGPGGGPQPGRRRREPPSRQQTVDTEEEQAEPERPARPSDSVWDTRPARRSSPVALGLDRKSILQGIVMKEVLSKPRGLRPWQPWGPRHN